MDRLGNRMTDDSWGRVRDELLKTVGRNNFVTWIEPLKLSELKGGIARFEVPTSFLGDWVSRNFAEQLIAAIRIASGNFGIGHLLVRF